MNRESTTSSATKQSQENTSLLNLNQSQEELDKVYSGNYYWYLRSWEFREKFLIPLGDLINKLGLPVLDVGCGEGQLATYVAVRYHGIDCSAVAIERASSLAYSNGVSTEPEKSLRTFCVARFEDFYSPEVKAKTVVFGGLFSVLIKPERYLDFIQLYIERFDPSYFIIYDLERTDLTEVNKHFHIIYEHHAVADLPSLQEVKRYRKFLCYKV